MSLHNASPQHFTFLAVVAGMALACSHTGCSMVRPAPTSLQGKLADLPTAAETSAKSSTSSAKEKVSDVSTLASSRRVALTYVAHMPEGGVFISQSGIQQAGGETDQTTDLGGQQWAMAELRIDLPHPDGRTDVGRATVELKPLSCGERCATKSLSEVRNDRQGERQSRYSMWVSRWFWRAKPMGTELPQNAVATLDLPRSEIERILAHLENQGHFRRGVEDQGPARLELLHNQRKISHACEYDAILDELVCQVWAQGHQELAARRREQQELQLAGHEVVQPARTAARSKNSTVQ